MTKIKVLLIFLVVITMTTISVSCTRKGQVDENSSKKDTLTASSSLIEGNDEYGDDSISRGKSLNDIRFANFEEKDWYDNEYIRTLRRYIDDLNKEKIDDEDVQAYRNDMKGKFVVAELQQHLLGGLLIRITFVDKPENVFNSWVYSYVDEDTETVTGYEVRSFGLEDGKLAFTKEQVLELVAEHPELKLW